jgi:hypothetical protein
LQRLLHFLIFADFVCATVLLAMGVRLDDHHLTIDDRLTGKIQGAGNDGEPFCPVQPVAREDLLPSLVEVNLNPVAVELDFMQPLRPLGRPGPQRSQLGLMKPGIFAGVAPSIARASVRLTITPLKKYSNRETGVYCHFA